MGAAAYAHDAHPERRGAHGDLGSDRANAENAERAPPQHPRQTLANELVLRPAVLALSIDDVRQLFRQRQRHRHHMFGNRRGLNAARIAEQDAAREQLRKADGFYGNRGGMDPAKPARGRKL
jgi:hypothetical protein